MAKNDEYLMENWKCRNPDCMVGNVRIKTRPGGLVAMDAATCPRCSLPMRHGDMVCLVCPECRSVYNDCPELGVRFWVNDVCGNESHKPPRCTSDNPCQGRLQIAETDADGRLML